MGNALPPSRRLHRLEADCLNTRRTNQSPIEAEPQRGIPCASSFKPCKSLPPPPPCRKHASGRRLHPSPHTSLLPPPPRYGAKVLLQCPITVRRHHLNTTLPHASPINASANDETDRGKGGGGRRRGRREHFYSYLLCILFSDHVQQHQVLGVKAFEVEAATRGVPATDVVDRTALLDTVLGGSGEYITLAHTGIHSYPSVEPWG
jgi:hypothetical protein